MFHEINNDNRVKLIDAIMLQVSNRKQYTKFSIGYLIGMINPHSAYSLYSDDFKREDIVNCFKELLHTDKGLQRMSTTNGFKHIFSQFNY